MKLLVVTASYPPHEVGGYEIRCKDVVDGLLRKGHEIVVLTDLCSNKDCKLCQQKDSIKRRLHLKVNSRDIFNQIVNDIGDLKYIDTLLKKFIPDFVYLWGIQNLSNTILPYFLHKEIMIVYDEGGSGLQYLHKIQGRGLYFYNNNEDSIVKKAFKKYTYYLTKKLSRNLIRPQWQWPADMRVIFNSLSAMDNANNSGLLLKNATVIHSGINLTIFPFKTRDTLRNPINIIVPGRIKPEKGTLDAILLVGELNRRNIPASLKIIGKIQDAKYFNEINENIHNVGLKGRIEYIPMVKNSELAFYYQDADFCFHPTYFKSGFSRVPLEAMACGCVVISYGNEGSREIINNSETGFLVAEGGLGEAAIVIEKLRNDATLFKRISENARQKIEQDFSFSRYLDQVESFLFDAYKQSGKSAIKKQ